MRAAEERRAAAEGPAREALQYFEERNKLYRIRNKSLQVER